MIDMSKHLIWALILFTVTTGPDGRETVTNSIPTYFETRAGCQAEGSLILSTAAVGQAGSIEYACVPREALTQAGSQ